MFPSVRMREQFFAAVSLLAAIQLQFKGTVIIRVTYSGNERDTEGLHSSVKGMHQRRRGTNFFSQKK